MSCSSGSGLQLFRTSVYIFLEKRPFTPTDCCVCSLPSLVNALSKVQSFKVSERCLGPWLCGSKRVVFARQGLLQGLLDTGSLRAVRKNCHIHELRGCDHCSSLIHFIYRWKRVHIMYNEIKSPNNRDMSNCRTAALYVTAVLGQRRQASSLRLEVRLELTIA